MKTSQSEKIKGTVAMLLATVIWGFAFSAQSSGMKFVSPMLFVMLRSLAGVAALTLFIILLDLYRFKKISFYGADADDSNRKCLLIGGILCGLAMTVASSMQQLGLIYAAAGKSGFLTALYIIIVPIIGIFFKRKAGKLLYFSIFPALFGTYLLCGGIGNIDKGDVFLIGCAFAFSLHIMLIDYYAPKCDCVRLSCVQFISCAFFSAAGSLLFGETWIINKILGALPFWIFCGIGSSAIAFTLQMYAQKYLHPVAASLLMSLESVFAVIGGWLFLNETISNRELLGCAMIMAAIIIAQIPEKEKIIYQSPPMQERQQ